MHAWIRSLAMSLALPLTPMATANAAALTAYVALSDWAIAINAPYVEQDFEGFANNTSLVGVELLPGIKVTTNLVPPSGPALIAFEPINDPDTILMSRGRLGASQSYYDIVLAQPYTAFSFEIDGFEAGGPVGGAAGPGTLQVLLTDGTLYSWAISGNPTGSPIFVGLIAGAPIERIRWNEPNEKSSGSCCEESGLDNFRVVAPTAVTEPSSGLLLLAAAGAWAWRGRRSGRRVG